MADIVLTTLNAKYIHAAFGLRYLLANLGPLRADAAIVEFDINQRPVDIAEALLARNPKIIGLGIYIWNVAPATEVVATLKRVRPDLTIILGGPEVSYETESQPIVQLADYVITGEADLAFAAALPAIAGGRAARPAKIIPAPPPEFSELALPYDLYDEQDVAHRIIYVEASRGCPFSCEFCLSSLDSSRAAGAAAGVAGSSPASARPRGAAVQVRGPDLQSEPRQPAGQSWSSCSNGTGPATSSISRWCPTGCRTPCAR